MTRAWVIAALALGACGRIGFGDVAIARTDGGATSDGAAPDGVAGLRPIHEYLLAGTPADTYGGAALTTHGGAFVAGGYQFAANQGLSIDGALPASVYSVDLVFAFDDLSGWKKILDFEGLTLDSGFYTFDNAVQYVVVPGSDFVTASPTLTIKNLIRVTLTRDASDLVVAYLNGAPLTAARSAMSTPPPVPPTTAFSFADPGRAAALTGTTATFFIDDTQTAGGESTSGVVRRIRIYDVALTATEVAAAQ
jgi:hypothetical protein